MNKVMKVVSVILVITAIILSSVLTYMFFYEPCEKVVLPEPEPEIEKHKYEIIWSEQNISMSKEQINKNLSKSNLFWDGKIINGLIDGTLQFYLDFNIGHKFLKEVKIKISWKDRYPLLGFIGRDKLYIDICTPLGGHESTVMEFPIFDFIYRLRNGENFFTTSTTTVDINECPPGEIIIANNSGDALSKYWEEYDILDYNKGYQGKWEVSGQSYMGEIRLIRRAKNIIRNLILNLLLDDALKIDVDYSFYTIELTELD